MKKLSQKIYDFYHSMLSGDQFNPAERHEVLTAIPSSIVGAIIGAIAGFQIGGIGGVIVATPIFWLVSAHLSAFIAKLVSCVPIALLFLGIYVGVFGGLSLIVWLIYSLWGVGK